MKQPAFPTVTAKYGAPTGRVSARVYHPITLGDVFPVPLEDGYDPGGVYWGANRPGKKLFVAVLHDGTQSYTRAADLSSAVDRFNESAAGVLPTKL